MKTNPIIPVLLAACTALCLGVLPLSAATFGNFTYTDNGTSITITDYPPSEIGEVIIPSIIMDKPVTSIGAYAFAGCSGLASATIPSSVTSIGLGAFRYCYGLTSVTIASGVTSIGDWMFFGCNSLTSVTIPSSVTSIGRDAFNSCIGLTSVTISAGVTSIGRRAFAGCSSLTSVTIPSSVTSIGYDAFSACIGLKSVTISAGVASIGDGAFYGCNGLTSVTIPSSVTRIGNFAFCACRGLTSVTISAGVAWIGESAFQGCSLTSVTIPSSVTGLMRYAFANCSSLSVASFSGNAPPWQENVFARTAPDFTVTYIIGTTGFSVPAWRGYPCVGLGGISEIDVQRPPGMSLVDGTSKKSFGTVVVGQSGTAKFFTIKNTGTGNLTGLAVSKDGTNAGNFLITPPFKTVLLPGASTTFKVTFKPTASGTRSAAIQIQSNDADENPFDIKLTGMGAL